MDLVELRNLNAARHPWELARAAFCLGMIREALRTAQGPVRVLDVGCGDAWFARQLLTRLPDGSRIVGWDSALDDAQLEALRPGLPDGLHLTSTTPEGAFDLILCMDVLEHVEDDHGFLRRVVGDHLKCGGKLLFTVPAWPGLFSVHDEALRHYRRYTPTTGRRLLAGAGLTILRAGGLFHSLAAVRWLQLQRWRRQGASVNEMGIGGWSGGRAVTATLTGALRLDGVFSAVAARCGAEAPGLSWWALCQR